MCLYEEYIRCSNWRLITDMFIYLFDNLFLRGYYMINTVESPNGPTEYPWGINNWIRNYNGFPPLLGWQKSNSSIDGLEIRISGWRKAPGRWLQ